MVTDVKNAREVFRFECDMALIWRLIDLVLRPICLPVPKCCYCWNVSADAECLARVKLECMHAGWLGGSLRCH